jgi:glycosyltransferase involved in cell wall biosynthesis
LNKVIGGNVSQRPASPASSVSVVPIFPSDGKASGKELRLALIGTFAPRKCGIATFTTDIRDQLALHNPEVTLDIYALEQVPMTHRYEGVEGVVHAQDTQAYVRAARAINESGASAVWIQHEFGIFGGPDGEMVSLLVDRIAAPIVFTFHTVLSEPTQRQREIMEHLVSRASRIMVMTRHARELLIAIYGASPRVVQVIPHGAPDRPFGREEAFKAALGHGGSPLITTFGLLGPGKGLERMIEAMPAILERHPQAIYRIVGVTHPALVEREGEAYRENLQDLARRLGVEHGIVWDNRFLDTDELLDQLEASDIFVTPYPNLQQSSSGTLSYALALGKAVVSTPYLHARELLADGVGVLVEPNSASAIATAINALLDDPVRLASVKLRAYRRADAALRASARAARRVV